MRSPDRLPSSTQAGFAVPTVTLMLLAAMAMAGVAVSASIGGQKGVVRDQGTKSALAVAESGVEEALLRYNRYGIVSDSAPCTPVGGTAVEADGWCPEVSATVNGEPVSYRVKPTSVEMPSGDTAWVEMEVVSTGTLAGATRRVDVVASSSAGQDIFLDATVQAEDGITLESYAEIHAGTATNGDLNIAANASQCGTATVGIGKELVGEGEYSTDFECGTAGGEPEEDEIELDPVNQADVPSENDNGRLFTKDQIGGHGNTKNFACFDGHNGVGQEDKSCGERELLIDSNASVTLGGSVYSFCKLTLKSNSSLYIDSDSEKQVTIYFDSPEACGYAGEEEPVTQLELLSNARITPVSAESGSAALLFVGSTSIETNILLNSETTVEDEDRLLCEQNFVMYAPRTNIEMDSNTSYCGAMAGKSILLDSNVEVWTSGGVQEFFLPLVAPHYVPSRFVDCTAEAPAGAPNEGC
jgi:hypothetical protein